MQSKQSTQPKQSMEPKQPEEPKQPMPTMLSNPVSRFRVVSTAEGCSFLILLIFGSLLSRISDIDLVMPLGALHGVLFVALVVITLDVRGALSWETKSTALALTAAVLPLGPFVFGYVRRAELRTAELRAAEEAVATKTTA